MSARGTRPHARPGRARRLPARTGGRAADRHGGDGRGAYPAPVDARTAERVREIVAGIPPGTVLSYGEVAARAGVPSARLVGRLLAEDGQDLPWHRVLRADGTCAPHLADEQLARLRAEGVRISGRRVRRSAGN